MVESASSSISVISHLRFRDRNFIVNSNFWEILQRKIKSVASFEDLKKILAWLVGILVNAILHCQ